MGTSSPPQKGGRGCRAPQFLAHFYCDQTAGCIKMLLDMEVSLGLSPGRLCVKWRPSPPLQKGAESPNFRPTSIVAKRCMDQDATWYGGGPRPTRHCVRCGPRYPHKKGHTHLHPIFGPRLFWPNGWMDEDAAWYGSRTRPRPHCTRRGPGSPERGTAAPLFSAHVYCGHGRPSQLLLSSYTSLMQWAKSSEATSVLSWVLT